MPPILYLLSLIPRVCIKARKMNMISFSALRSVSVAREAEHISSAPPRCLKPLTQLDSALSWKRSKCYRTLIMAASSERRLPDAARPLGPRGPLFDHVQLRDLCFYYRPGEHATYTSLLVESSFQHLFHSTGLTFGVILCFSQKTLLLTKAAFIWSKMERKQQQLWNIITV